MPPNNSIPSVSGDQKPNPTKKTLSHNEKVTATSYPDARQTNVRHQAGIAARRSAETLQRRRAVTSTSASSSARPHLEISLGPVQAPLNQHSHEAPPKILTSPASPPTAPIVIPQRKDTLGRPVTPLSGRPREFKATDSAAFLAHKVKYSSSSSSQDSSEKSTSPAKPHSFEISTMDPRSRPNAVRSSIDRHASPLSPTRPIPRTPTKRQQEPGAPHQHLNLAGLPEFHPANFPLTGHNAPVPPRTARNITSASRSTRPVSTGSDAQQKLQQYQRSVVASFSRAVNSPKSPRLVPQESPSEAMTPLQLEASGDYLTAGSRPPRMKGGSIRRQGREA
ncbi:uncharacterized protein KY384_008238 [Bacidia gigantensis]|uniref:uncharacterized protein n=1 Tax=Bacidia gigantensis TaxID=2732470 RepID=UPI001D04E2B8|nr:uncharacterized protein KY384_008238 [Bacidia gigantensis]KAG8526809.1 hypothetical protein KY384_008238 [Bacidia gigantensis]